jgi:hypothetical protein
MQSSSIAMPVTISDPTSVIQTLQHTLKQYMLKPESNGRLAVLCGVPDRHGHIQGEIQWGLSVPYIVSCEQIKNFQIGNLLRHPPEVAEILDLLSNELNSIWISSVKAHNLNSPLTVSGEIVVKTEYQRDKKRFRIVVNTSKTQRLFTNLLS